MAVGQNCLGVHSEVATVCSVRYNPRMNSDSLVLVINSVGMVLVAGTALLLGCLSRRRIARHLDSLEKHVDVMKADLKQFFS
jgi:cytochrome c-type biogenesis protein CcmH/NrfF